MSIYENLPPQARKELKEVGWAKGVELAKVARRDRQAFDCATWLHKARLVAPYPHRLHCFEIGPSVLCGYNVDPGICHGKPVIRGTRTPVSIVVGSLAGGMSFEEVQREYDLTIEDIRAALKFAGELVDQEQHHPLPT